MSNNNLSIGSGNNVESKEIIIRKSMSYLAYAIRTRADGDMYRPLLRRLNEELQDIIKNEGDLDSVIQEFAEAA